MMDATEVLQGEAVGPVTLPRKDLAVSQSHREIAPRSGVELHRDLGRGLALSSLTRRASNHKPEAWTKTRRAGFEWRMLLEKPAVPADNNLAERDIRSVPPPAPMVA